MFRPFAVTVAFLLGGTAYASDKPIYAPAPAWVKPAPPLDTAKLNNDSPVVLLYDNQQKLEKGQVWTYIESETRAASTQALTAIGTIQLPWQPDHGDLIIHKAEIIRDGEHIDLLKGGQPFSVLRREQQLSKLVIDGTLTATMPVEGLRVGDVLHLALSITLTDTTLKGKLQTGGLLLRDPLRVQFARLRMIWPENEDIHWKNYSGATIPDPVTINGYRELTVTLPIAKEPEIPKDAPTRFKPLPLIEASNFTDWAQVSTTMAPLYATDGLIDPKGPIAAEVARIMAASTDPLERAAAALQTVQDKVRYQLIALNTGNYVPQTPAETWSLRYGDCKAKTLLLLAMLHAMGIEAEPVLASLQLGGLVTSRLPAAGAFDHVFVKATVNGETLWLDGTGAGSRLADIHDVPAIGAVLPVRTAGASLITLPNRTDARPDGIGMLSVDSSAGVNLPAPFTMALTLRGATAEQLRLVAAQSSRDDIEKLIANAVGKYIDNGVISGHALTFDDKAGTATLSANGVSYPDWSRQDDRAKTVLDTSPASIEFDADRGRPAWQAIPVATGNPEYLVTTTHIKLPHGGAGFALEGEAPLDTVVAGAHLVRKTTLSGDTITVEVSRSTNGAEIPVSAIAAERKHLAAIQAQSLRAVAPADYPSYWQEVNDAKRAHKLDPIIAVYTKRIADKPDQVDRYTDRAWLYERVYERQKAIDDLTKATAIAPDASIYLRRASLYRDLKNLPLALADARAALELEPKSAEAASRIAEIEYTMGHAQEALALLQERIDQGGDDKNAFINSKAEVQANSGDTPGALAMLDAAIVKSPGRPDLLNSRCWVKGSHNVALDTALKDCTKAIELADNADAALDSRAMVYFRMNRLDDALADLNAVLTRNPDMAASLFMRAIIRRKTGDAAGSAADLAAARGLYPTIDERYAHYGISAS